jgi:hypothetical protein
VTSKLNPHAGCPAMQNAVSCRPEATPRGTSSTTIQVHTPEPGQLERLSGSKPVSKRLHRKKAADYIGTSLSWLDKSRLKGDGPVFLQIGGRVVYDTADLDDYLARCRRRSTSEAP